MLLAASVLSLMFYKDLSILGGWSKLDKQFSLSKAWIWNSDRENFRCLTLVQWHMLTDNIILCFWKIVTFISCSCSVQNSRLSWCTWYHDSWDHRNIWNNHRRQQIPRFVLFNLDFYNMTYIYVANICPLQSTFGRVDTAVEHILMLACFYLLFIFLLLSWLSAFWLCHSPCWAMNHTTNWGSIFKFC